MFVKICGMTRVEDAMAAVDAGAGAIGFIFWPASPRFIDPHRARKIAAMLPPFVTAVGVFVNQPLDYVNGVSSLVRLGAVQLHGDETPAFAAAVTSPVIKAMSLGAGDVQAWPAEVRLLLDVHDPAVRGGTGRTIDWTAAADVAAQRQILLAGGLTPDNVADAVARVRPFGIDVSSGVERAPGIKDHRRLQALFEAVHDAGHITTRS
ncbi:MAG TPA: phosphoribosylanthranilate isomerase [Vicinamibacterales bacterium]|jgi:phosphoribosylanthranilate isomerase|nr:phosphoribosylanthranilate isomerase [Vicinamibacterales bacterium]